jgi:tripartite-type tricarboxylate transporter receptor subunit TctC
MIQTKPILRGTLAFAALLCCAATSAFAQTDFYKGKTVNIVVGTGAGGGYDYYGRVVARYLPSQIPGTPNMVVQNMPGASSRVAAMHLSSVAAKDGTVIGILTDNVVNNALLEDKIPFDLNKFNWLARLNSYVGVGVASKVSGVTSVKDAYTRQVTIGAAGIGSSMATAPMLLNQYEKTKFKIVYGYPSSREITLAMERGEVDAIGIVGWEALKPDQDMLKKVNMLYQSGLERHPDLPDVPLMHELGSTSEAQSLLKFFAASSTIGRSFVAPPGVPADRIKILRDGFQKMIAAQDFKDEIKKQNIELDTATGEKIAEMVAVVLATPPNVIEVAKASVKKE